MQYANSGETTPPAGVHVLLHELKIFVRPICLVKPVLISSLPGKRDQGLLLEIVVRDSSECLGYGIEDPLLCLFGRAKLKISDGVVGQFDLVETHSDALKPWPPRRVRAAFFIHGLNPAVHHGQDPKRPAFSTCFRYVYLLRLVSRGRSRRGIDHCSSSCAFDAAYPSGVVFPASIGLLENTQGRLE